MTEFLLGWQNVIKVRENGQCEFSERASSSVSMWVGLREGPESRLGAQPK